MPRVWETVTASPSPTASTVLPRAPTSDAATSVLPWPGVSAWAAPRPIAVRSDISSTTGDRSAAPKIAGGPSAEGGGAPGVAVGSAAPPGVARNVTVDIASGVVSASVG